jgi:hypothetical protein
MRLRPSPAGRSLLGGKTATPVIDDAQGPRLAPAEHPESTKGLRGFVPRAVRRLARPER